MSQKIGYRQIAFGVALMLGLSTSPARAERDLAEAQEASWIGHQFAAISVLSLANLAALSLGSPATSAKTNFVVGDEAEVRNNYSPLSERISDLALIGSLMTPPLTLATRGRVSWENALLVYTQAVEASFLANTLTKRLVRRARPYTYGPHRERIKDLAEGDAFYSFYSGHTSTSFTAAVSGSLLFSVLEPDEGKSMAHFGGTLALAALTGHARVRAGRHYPSDVLVGALVGAGFGFLIPALHSVPLRMTPLEGMGALGGVALGYLAGFALPSRLAQNWASLHPVFQTAPGGGVLYVGGSLL